MQKLAKDKRDQIIERNKRIDEGLFSATMDPRVPMKAPAREIVPPFLNFAPLDNGLAALQRVTDAYDKALAQASENGGAALAHATLKEANEKLIAVERECCPFYELDYNPSARHLTIVVDQAEHEPALRAIAYSLGFPGRN